MSENNSHQMQVHMGYNIDTTALEQINRTTESLNRTNQAVAQGFRSIEQAVANIANAQNRYTQATDRAMTVSNNYVRRLQTEIQANVTTQEQAIDRLSRRAQVLQNLLSNPMMAQNQNRITQMLAQTNVALDRMQKQALAGHIKYENAKLAETKRVNREAVAAEKAKFKELQNQWQQGAKQYQNLMAQWNAASTLKDFSGTTAASNLKSGLIQSAISLAGIRTLTAEFQNLGREIIEIDYQLVNTQRIMQDFSDETADYLLSNAAETARLTNIQITDAQEIQSAWVRINDTYAQNKELLSEITTLTSKFMNVAEIKDAESAVTLLNASLLQFNVSAAEAVQVSEEFLNKWAYMADKTAMGTADEYGEAIAKFGAQLNALGGDMDDAIALSSIMADRLAKDGAEAGNSLKTITTYLNRQKTVSLFSQIAEDLGDANFQLMDANGRFKDFDTTLRTVAKAYEIYTAAGNDAMAQDILNALGATRQRDAALAVLTSVNAGEYDTYLQQVNESADNYLNDQNAAMMETFKAQWNDLKVSIEEFGMAFARSGLLDGIGLLMNGMSGLLSVVADIPEPIMAFANALLMLKGANAAIEYLGKLTGATQQYKQLMNQGTADEIAAANSINATTNAYKVRQEAYIQEQLHKANLGQLNDQEKAALSALIAKYNEQIITLAELEMAYNNGEINAAQYTQAVHNTVSAEELQGNAVRRTRTELLQQTGVLEANTQANNRNSRSKLALIAQETKDAYARAKSTWALKANTLAQQSNTTATGQATASSTLATLANKALAAGYNTVGVAAGVAAAGAKLFMSALNPVLSIISIVTTVLSLGSLFGSMFSEAADASDVLNELEQELDDVTERIKELNGLEATGDITDAEKAELEYLREKNDLLAEQIQLKKQAQNNETWNSNGGWFGWGVTEGSQEALDKMLSKYNQLKTSVQTVNDTLASGTHLVWNEAMSSYEEVALTKQDIAGYNARLEEYNKSLRASASDLVAEYYRLNEAVADGAYSDEALESVKEYLADLEAMFPELKDVTLGHQKLSEVIANLSAETEEYAEDISALNDKISDLNDLYEEYNKEGFLSYETVSKLVSEHPEYVKYLVKVGDQYKLNKVAEQELNKANQEVIETTDELIAKLSEEGEAGQLISDQMIAAVDAVDAFTIGINDTFGDIAGVTDFVNNLRQINTDLLMGVSSIEEYNTSMNELINSVDFSKVNDDLSEMDETTRQVAESQQAMLTSLAQEVGAYMSEITNALFNGQMTATEYVNALQGSNENILDMYVASNDLVQNQAGQWVDAAGAVDTYANSLQNAISGLNGMADATQFLEEHQSILADLQANTANNMVDATWWAANQQSSAYQAMATDFSSLMGNMYTNNRAAWEQIVADVLESTNYQTTSIVNSNGTITETAQNNAAIMGAFTTATMNTVGTAVDNAATAAGNVISALGDVIRNFDYTIEAKPYISGGFGLTTNKYGIPTGITLPSFGFTIHGSGGDNVQTLADALSSFGSSLNDIDFNSFFGNIGSYTGSSYQSPSFNGLGSGGYSPSDYNTTATRTPTGTGAADKASKEAAEALEDFAKEVEKLTKEYVKEVESLQKRIANALKEKYQQQYEERKKLLEKEHNERVEQIQAEIDAINGVRPQDKQAKLADLYESLEQWSQDDSTLGKAKQKELLAQIEDLEKEIRIDDLEQKLEEENATYKDSIDQDSQFYDATLKRLDQLMSDEYLYKEANYLIANGKEQEIIDLLTEFDSQWDGWATLMGQTAGEVIAGEVAEALRQYKAVVNGTVANDVTTKSGSSGATSTGGTTGGSYTGTSTTTGGGGKVRITNGSAGMYVASDSATPVNTWSGYTGQYYIVNERNGRVALARQAGTNGAGAIGWIDKQYVVGLATGGYTGANEGLAYLHAKERVLNAKQTTAFENLVYNFLPRIESSLLNPMGGTINSGGNTTFNREVVKIDIDKVINNTPADINNGVDNIDRTVRNALKKSGVNIKKG